MAFDLGLFRSVSLSPREAEMPFPGLEVFFPEGEKPVWKVRGLTGEEVARALESASRHKYMILAIQALMSQSAPDSDKLSAMKTLAGYGDEVPESLAKKLDYLVFGSVSPAMDRGDAVRLFAALPNVAYQLTAKIEELTAIGPDLGKVTRSTAGTTSEPL
jgi:hypothetical protein